MPAPAANNNAEKWTLQTTLTTLEKIKEEAESPYVAQLGRALQCAGIYQGIWTYWKKKWALNEKVMDEIYSIEQLFINKTLESGMSKRIPASICLFILRTNYGMNDKKEIQEKLPTHLAPEFPAEPETKPAKKEKEKAKEERPADPETEMDIAEKFKKTHFRDWPNPTTEECLSDNPPFAKDFRPRAEDSVHQAHARMRAAERPDRYFSIEPECRYMLLAPDLYKCIG